MFYYEVLWATANDDTWKSKVKLNRKLFFFHEETELISDVLWLGLVRGETSDAKY